MLLVCGIASAQSSYKPVGARAKAKLQTVSSPSTSRSTFAKNRKLRKKARQRGQQKIDAARAREIQQALIRDHYMDGEASGVWDAKSQNAMVRFQGDNGWQSKVVPDSRALIKLGLGPDHEHLLNPESAMTSQQEPPRASPMLNQSPAMVPLPQK
jgi:peptidoglycan hydrolase-like protein with peptidoglycan-binding domain